MTDTVALLGVALTAAGLAAGLYQYRVNSIQANLARRRERAVMATNQTREFLADPSVRFVMELLDYGEAPFADVALNGFPPFTRDQLKGALEVHWVGDKGIDAVSKQTTRPDFRAVRSSFDNFLFWLESIEVLISNDVISVVGFGDLFSYWLILLGEIPNDNDTIVHLDDVERAALWDYIRGYNFDLVVRLFARYGRAGKVGVKCFRPRSVQVTADQPRL